MWGVAASSPALRKSCPHLAQGLPFTQTSGATQHQGAQLLHCDGQAHLVGGRGNSLPLALEWPEPSPLAV